MKPYFSVIIPTYKRAQALTRAIDSVLNQGYENVRVIVINDSPDDDSYKAAMEAYASDPSVIYLVNEKNSGVNFSRNKGIDHADENSWIIFLDDDDRLADRSLAELASLIEKHAHANWFVTNRAYADGNPLTKIKKEGLHDDYASGFLLTKKYSGDATHCIRKSATKGIYFPKTVRQGDEWLFYYELSTKTPFFYNNINTTITDGYAESGLNYRKRGTLEQLQTLAKLFKEGVSRGIGLRASFLAYAMIRILRAFIK